MVEPFLKSLKALTTLAESMSSEKVALMLAAGPTSPRLGEVLVTLGAVVSSTVTEKVAVELLPAASVAEQLTDVVPIGKVLPEGGVQLTATEPSMASSAVALKVTTAPSGLVASFVMGSGTLSTGGVVSAGGV